MTEFKVGDVVRLEVDWYDGGEVGDVKKGSLLKVSDSCETSGQWIDTKTVKVEMVNRYKQEFILISNMKNKFAVGDKVISIKNTPDTEEGWIGFIDRPSEGFDWVAKPVVEGLEKAFREDELELLSAAKDPDCRNRDDITPQDIAGVSKSALDKQVSGNHYKDCKIQPIEYIQANGLSYLEGNVIKYTTRHSKKNGKADIEKAIHYLELILEMEYKDKE